MLHCQIPGLTLILKTSFHFHFFQAFPLDAGTDNGFTFTSPNWATEPRGEVFRMTSQFPAHPAGSFNYPHLDHLPTIAVFKITKVLLGM